jgi:hypothetical protein
MNGWLDAYERIGLPVQQRLLGKLLFFGVTEIGRSTKPSSPGPTRAWATATGAGTP